MKAFFGLIGSLGLIIVVVLVYHEYFSKIEIDEEEIGPYVFATKRFIGSYSKVSETMNEVDKYLRELGINGTTGVGMYYDNPAKTKQDELRSDVGNVIEETDEDTLSKIREKFEIKEFEEQRVIMTKFPIKSPLSYIIGPMKAYPAIDKFMKENGYESSDGGYGIELYNIPGKTITYIMTLHTKEDE